jgi:HPr kinase/phosphorylase
MTEPDASASSRPRVPSAVHATAVAVGEAGVLIRGVSGAGKSKLALAMLAEAGRKGVFARLICDDRVRLSLSGGRLLAHAHPAIAGKIEGRGEGILSVEHEASAVVRVVVDLVDPQAGRPSRLPDAAEKTAEIGGISLPRLSLCQDRPATEAAQRILAFLGNA